MTANDALPAAAHCACDVLDLPRDGVAPEDSRDTLRQFFGQE